MWICPNCGREFKRTNQSHYCGEAPKTVNEYINKQENYIKPLLLELQKTINEAVPDTEETISWSMPTWKKGKYNVIHFAVNKNYIGIYLSKETVETFKEELKNYKVNKGVIHLKLDQEIPKDLITKIAQYSYEKNNIKNN